MTRGRILVGAAILAISVAALVLMFSSTNRPTVQQPFVMPGMGTHFLNLWIQPDPPQLGSAELVFQVVDVGGNPRSVEAIAVGLSGAAGEVIDDIDGTAIPLTNRTDAGRFRVNVQLLSQGEWEAVVTAQMNGQRSTVRVPFVVVGVGSTSK